MPCLNAMNAHEWIHLLVWHDIIKIKWHDIIKIKWHDIIKIMWHDIIKVWVA